jgi:rubredoxin
LILTADLLYRGDDDKRGDEDLDVPDLRLDLRRGCGTTGRGDRPGTKWEELPPNWTCPECGARKEDFEMVEI